jgi:hypothetical protein
LGKSREKVFWKYKKGIFAMAKEKKTCGWGNFCIFVQI